MIDDAAKILEQHLQHLSEQEQSCGMECSLAEKTLAFEQYKLLFKENKVQTGIRPEKFSWEEIKTYSPKTPRWVALGAFLVGVATFFTPFWFLGFVGIIASIFCARYAYLAFYQKVEQSIQEDFCPFEKWYDEQKFALRMSNGTIIAFPENWVHALYEHNKK